MADDKYVKALETGIVEYISAAQPRLDKLAEAQRNDAEFVKRASQTIGMLAGMGIVAKSDVNQVVDKIAEDHTKVFDILEKIASSVSAESIGSKSNEQEMPEAVDPRDQVFLDVLAS